MTIRRKPPGRQLKFGITKSDLKIIGVQMAMVRRIRRLTKHEVAIECGVSDPFYGRVEGGTRKPSIDLMLKIQKVLGARWILVLEQETMSDQVVYYKFHRNPRTTGTRKGTKLKATELTDEDV